MLQSIREHTQGWIAGTIVSFLILSFALWGIHSYFSGSGATNVVAKVNGVEITKEQVTAAAERLQRQSQTQFNANPGLSDQLEDQLRKQALTTLINIQVLAQASVDQGYRVSLNQINGYLQTIPDFQVNGHFSYDKFRQLLAASRFSPQGFLDMIQTSLLIDQPRLGLIFSSFALPDEIVANYAIIEQQREVAYALLPIDIRKQSTTISDQAIEAYYNQHQSEFQTPEQMSIAYIPLTIENVTESIHPSDAALQHFYDENASSFNKPFSAVKAKVKEAYIHQRAEEQFAELKEKLASVTYEHSDNLEIAAKTLNLSVNKTGFFSREQGGKDEITSNPKVRSIAFSSEVLNQQNNSDVIPIGSNKVIVLRVDAHHASALLPLSQVRKTIEDQLMANAIEDNAIKLANEIKTKLQQGASLNAVTSQYHLTWTQVGYLGRHSHTVDSAILDTAFQIPKPTTDRPIQFDLAKTSKGFAIVSIKGIKEADLNAKTNHEQYQIFAEQIQNADALLEYELYKQSLVKQAKIKVENS